MSIHLQELNASQMSNKEIIETLAKLVTQAYPIYEKKEIPDHAESQLLMRYFLTSRI